MKIATYVDASGEIANVYDKGMLRLYDNASGPWLLVREIPLNITTDMGLASVKAALHAAITQMDGCRTLLSGEVRGLIYSLLQEEGGFRVWKSQGRPETQLEQIACQDAALAIQREKEAAERAFAALFSSPSGGCGGGGGSARKRTGEALRAVRSMTESLGDGQLRINLSDILTRYKNANSMDVLIPLLEDRQFLRLEILCDHIPRWFERKVADLGLTAEIKTSDTGIHAVVFPNSCQGHAL